MKLKCKIAGHARADGAVYNSGFFFGRCGHCRADLIRTGKGGWQEVPEGHVVTWKAGSRQSHSLPADFTGLLPIPVVDARPRAQLPATRDGFFSWSRALVGLAPRRWRGMRAAEQSAPAAANEVEEKPLPALLVAALLLGASMRLLLSPRRR
ncbi:MAG TPA: hypothetical protein VGC46_03875 [Allosphingosinicella sp.]